MCIAHASQTYGGHHYFTTNNGDWPTSQGTCASQGGHLVKIETSGEDGFVMGLAGGSYTWIGLHDPSGKRVFVWTDGTPLQGYNGFSQPIGKGDCVDRKGTWSPYDCSYGGHGGVCECE
jgi:hypothetical protein